MEITNELKSELKSKLGKAYGEIPLERDWTNVNSHFDLDELILQGNYAPKDKQSFYEKYLNYVMDGVDALQRETITTQGGLPNNPLLRHEMFQGDISEKMLRVFARYTLGQTNIFGSIPRKWLSWFKDKYALYELDLFNKSNESKFCFYDTGLVCYMLGIKDVEQLRKHDAYERIFKNFVLNEVIKILYHYVDIPLIHSIYYIGEEVYRINMMITEEYHHNILIRIAPLPECFLLMNLKFFGEKSDEKIIVYLGKDTPMPKILNSIPMMSIKEFLNYFTKVFLDYYQIFFDKNYI